MREKTRQALLRAAVSDMVDGGDSFAELAFRLGLCDGYTHGRRTVADLWTAVVKQR